MPYLPSDRTSTLADVAACTPWLEVACRRCGRHGKLRVARLIREFGANSPAYDAAKAQAHDCPRRGETRITELCQVSCPTLAQFMDPNWKPPEKDRRWFR